MSLYSPPVIQPGYILGYTSYNPGTLGSYTTTSATFADVDATNLKVTFTAPPSGNVLIEMSAYCFKSGSSADVLWSLRDGGSNITGSEQTVTYLIDAVARPWYSFVVTGLTPGTSYTYEWGWARAGSGTGNLSVGGSASAGAATMKVTALA